MTERLQKIHARCTECGDCLLWTGATNHKGHPKLHCRSARRVVWEEATGKPLKPNQLMAVTCGNGMCLNFQHLKLTNKSEVSRKSNARESVKLKRSRNAARTNQPLLGKIDMDKARYIRASEKTGRALAAELGVSADLISKVRQHRAWKEYSNPFGGLMR